MRIYQARREQIRCATWICLSKNNSPLLRLLIHIIYGVTFIAVILLFAPDAKAAGADTEAFFSQNCIGCHTIGGGRLTGPDLKDVKDRADRKWIVKFLQNPEGMINGGDAYALDLKTAARGVVMPRIVGLNEKMAEALVDLINAESLLEESQFKGIQVSDEPFTFEEIATGRAYFLGEIGFENGAPPCISCHTSVSVPGLGGGRLGPDLSRVFERLEGRRNLASWLLAPATSTMQPVFSSKGLKPVEILALVAYLESESRIGGEDKGAGPLGFLLIGLVGAFLMYIAFDAIWKFRFKAVRVPLVEGGSDGGGK